MIKRKAPKKKASAKKKRAAKKAPKRKGSANPKGQTPPALEATKWVAGQSGNPAGRPKKLSIQELVYRVLAEEIEDTNSVWNDADQATKAEIVARRIVTMLMNGDQRILRLFLDRDWPVAQKVELSVPDGVEIGTSDDFIDLLMEKVTEARRANRSVEVELPAGT